MFLYEYLTLRMCMSNMGIIFVFNMLIEKEGEQLCVKQVTKT
jgi:hypothetical protein